MIRITPFYKFQDKIDMLYKNRIPVLKAFVKYFSGIHDNKKVIDNMKIYCEIDSK